MDYEVKGILRYTETPIEEAWVAATRKAGLTPLRPEQLDLTKGSGEVLIEREVSEKNNTNYRRWILDELEPLGPDGTVLGITVGELVQYINDPRSFREVVTLGNPNRHPLEIDIYFDPSGRISGFEAGDRVKTNIPLSEILVARGYKQTEELMESARSFKTRVDADTRDEKDSLDTYALIGFVRQENFNYESLFDFFLQK